MCSFASSNTHGLLIVLWTRFDKGHTKQPIWDRYEYWHLFITVHRHRLCSCYRFYLWRDRFRQAKERYRQFEETRLVKPQLFVALDQLQQNNYRMNIAPATTETHHQDTFRRSHFSLHCTYCLELSEQLHCR